MWTMPWARSDVSLSARKPSSQQQQGEPPRIWPRWSDGAVPVLSWPREQPALHEVWTGWLRLLSRHGPVVLLVDTLAAAAQVRLQFEQEIATGRLLLLLVPACPDPWIGRWAPVLIHAGNRLVALMPEVHGSADACGSNLVRRLGLQVRALPAELSLGSITFLPANTALLPSRTAHDEAPLPRGVVQRLLADHFGIQRLVETPEPVSSTTLHSGSLVRMIGPDQAVVAAFPWGSDLARYADQVASRLRFALGSTCAVSRIPCDTIVQTPLPDGGHTRHGERIGLTRIGHLLLVPAFGTPGEPLAPNQVRSNLWGAATALGLEAKQVARAGARIEDAFWAIPAELFEQLGGSRPKAA